MNILQCLLFTVRCHYVSEVSLIVPFHIATKRYLDITMNFSCDLEGIKIGEGMGGSGTATFGDLGKMEGNGRVFS